MAFAIFQWKSICLLPADYRITWTTQGLAGRVLKVKAVPVSFKEHTLFKALCNYHIFCWLLGHVCNAQYCSEQSYEQKANSGTRKRVGVFAELVEETLLSGLKLVSPQSTAMYYDNKSTQLELSGALWATFYHMVTACFQSPHIY